MVKLVIDMSGGDNGVSATIGGVKLFLHDYSDVEFVLVGKKEELKEFENNERCTIIDAQEIAPMECTALEAMRNKETSVYKAVNAVKELNADGVVSAGSTGAFLSLTTLINKRIEGVSRPALILPFPTKQDNKYVVFLDVGASNENSPEELYQFAKMGEAYYRVVFNKENPTLYLMSNGTEEGKGSPITKEAFKLLKDDKNFKGYIEARAVYEGHADVVAMDGFTGNVFLKGAEGMAKMMSGMIKDAFKSSFVSKIGYLFARKGFKGLSNKMDYKKVGGALLLGVNTIPVKAHGNSDPNSFYCSIRVCYNLAKGDVVNKIKQSLNGAK